MSILSSAHGAAMEAQPCRAVEKELALTVLAASCPLQSAQQYLLVPTWPLVG
jgi:hypothetical protein